MLQIPYAAQQCMASKSTPVLSGAIPALEMLILQWDALGTNAPQFAPYVKVGLEWARDYYQRMGQTRAYTIAMCKS